MRMAAILLRVTIRRPRLWPEALRTAWSMRTRSWWRRPPFLPLPHSAYLRWRLATAYGAGGRPSGEDVAAFLEWRRTLRRLW